MFLPPQLSGNYGYFNVLTATLCIPTLDHTATLGSVAFGSLPTLAQYWLGAERASAWLGYSSEAAAAGTLGNAFDTAPHAITSVSPFEALSDILNRASLQVYMLFLIIPFGACCIVLNSWCNLGWLCVRLKVVPACVVIITKLNCSHWPVLSRLRPQLVFNWCAKYLQIWLPWRLVQVLLTQTGIV
jgi:hypothetical protein